MDRRIIKTENAFMDALIEALVEKPLQKITVKELCERANMNRGTFYLHYKDVYDLMDKTETHMVNKIFEACDFDNNSRETRIDEYDSILLVFNYIKDHKDLYRTLISSTDNLGFIKKLVEMIHDRVFDELTKSLPNINPDTIRSASMFFVGGSVSMFVDWVVNDCSSPPEETIMASSAIYDYIYHEKSKRLNL